MIQQHETDSPNPRRTGLTGLVVLNAALLATLAAVTFAPSVQGQAAARQRGDYTMVAGGVNGIDSDAVYIVDATNQELIAVTYNQSTKLIEGIGSVNLATDAAEVVRGRTNRPTQP